MVLKHVILTSDYTLPFSQGFTLEDATGLAIKGDVDVHSIYATSLPTSHPSFSLQQVLEMSDKWKSRPLPGLGDRSNSAFYWDSFCCKSLRRTDGN